MQAEGAETAQSASTLDVSGVSRLRARIGRAATSLRVLGFLSAGDAFFLSGDAGVSFPFDLLVAVAVFWLARFLAKRMRSGTSWAIRAAWGWVAVSSAWTALTFIPKLLNAGLSGYGFISLMMFVVPLCFLARGLIEWNRWHATGGAATTSAGPLAGFPWERGRRGRRKRPRFLNKKSASAYVFLVLTPLPWIMLALSSVNQPEMTGDSAERAGRYAAMILMHLLVWLWMVRIYRKARRHAMLRASEVVRADPRAAVLYLRSFKDDKAIRVRARATNGRILPERLVKVAFEEVITDHLWSYGPVVAIGDPALKDERAPLGAARDFAADAEWQAKATDLMRAASIIVATVGRTEGFVWEIEQILSARLRSKLILLLPPVGAKQARARWEFLRSRVPSALIPADVDARRTRAVVFPRDMPIVIQDRTRNGWTYETVLDAAVLAIDQKPP
jgi:hypothetical protein